MLTLECIICVGFVIAEEDMIFILILQNNRASVSTSLRDVMESLRWWCYGPCIHWFKSRFVDLKMVGHRSYMMSVLAGHDTIVRVNKAVTEVRRITISFVPRLVTDGQKLCMTCAKKLYVNDNHEWWDVDWGLRSWNRSSIFSVKASNFLTTVKVSRVRNNML